MSLKVVQIVVNNLSLEMMTARESVFPCCAAQLTQTNKEQSRPRWVYHHLLECTNQSCIAAATFCDSGLIQEPDER